MSETIITGGVLCLTISQSVIGIVVSSFFPSLGSREIENAGQLFAHRIIPLIGIDAKLIHERCLAQNKWQPSYYSKSYAKPHAVEAQPLLIQDTTYLFMIRVMI